MQIYNQKISINNKKVTNSKKEQSENVQNYNVKCRIKGITYDTISEASQKLNLSETTIRRRLRNKDEEDNQILEKTVVSLKKISINGIVYQSMKQVLKPNIEGAETRAQVLYQIFSTKEK